MGTVETLMGRLAEVRPTRRFGTVSAVDTGAVRVLGLAHHARLGDRVSIALGDSGRREGEIVALSDREARAMMYEATDGIAIGADVELLPEREIRPDLSWTGRVIDAFGAPLDGGPLTPGPKAGTLRAAPPPAAGRRRLGARVGTGLAAFDTMLPLARGQRIGIFAGSGVGKTSLLADLARGVEADVVVFVLIGERGRELRDFVEDALGSEGLARSVVIAATSDQSPLIKRRAAWLAMSVAECFRDAGQHVLLIVDSISRFAEAHREVALTAGETPSLRAFPPSTAALIAGLAERAGPGPDREGMGDISAIFSVLVAGSDMEEPVADITRGILDGHIILDREIAERGRFPAIDVRRSVSRSLPGVAAEHENALIARARRVVATYEQAAPMVQAGLYVAGSDPAVDEAITLWPKLDAFFSARASAPEAAFEKLEEILGSEA
ncbi:MAG: FliI/YscN family ATPase [Pseudomonadota bacterium]